MRIGGEKERSGTVPVLVKLHRPPPEIRIFRPGSSAWSSSSTRRPRCPATAAHIRPAAPGADHDDVELAHRGAAARCSRSLMAAPNPASGTAMTDNAAQAEPCALPVQPAQALEQAGCRFHRVGGAAQVERRAPRRAKAAQRRAGPRLPRCRSRSAGRRGTARSARRARPGERRLRDCSASAGGDRPADRPDQRLDHLRREPAGAEAGRVGRPTGPSTVDSTPDRAGATIHHGGDPSLQPVQHVVRGGGRHAARPVRRGRRDRAARPRATAPARPDAPEPGPPACPAPHPPANATGQVTRRGSTIVSGPGQNASARVVASAVASTWRNAAATSG